MGIDLRLGRDAVPAVPVIRFFTWKSDTISIGRNQDCGKRINLDFCRRDGIEVVRRPTGGRELLHGHDLCYSVVWPISGSMTAIGAGETFARINDILILALRRLKVEASRHGFSRGHRASSGPCFGLVDRGEISVDKKKLLASAQRIFEKAVLQQGSMPLTEPTVDLTRYLRANNQIEMRRRLAGSTTCLYDHIDETFSVSSIVEIFRGEFQMFFGSENDDLQWDLENSGFMFADSRKEL